MNTELKQVETVTLLGKEFVIYGTVEEPLFKAKDVADWIEHSNVSAMVQSIDEDEKLTLNIAYSELQKHNELFLTENGVYEVLMLSRKPSPKDGVKRTGTKAGNTDWNIIININRVNRNKVII